MEIFNKKSCLKNKIKSRILSYAMILMLVITNSNITFAETTKQYNLVRLSGQNRYETSFNIAKEFESGFVDNVIVTSGNDFPDALTGSVLSKGLNAPILLLNNKVDNSNYSINYIKDHLKKDGTIYILGGIGVVSNDFINQFNTLGFKNIIRLGGIDRFDTNKKIIDQLAPNKGTPIIIANGYDFADALSVSSIAAIKGYPIFLSKTKSIPESIKSKISELQPSKVYILGGIGALTENIKDQVKSLTSLTDADILRIGGESRYETSLNICNTFKLNTDTIVIANGEKFPDTLSGSALAAKRNSPIVLTNGKDIDKQKEYIDKSDYTKIILLGGSAAIDKSVEDKFDKVVDNTNSSQGGGSTNPTTDHTNILLKVSRNFGMPQLQWNAIEGASYQVKRGEDKEKLEIVAENITENTFIDANSAIEKQYFYSVTAKKDGKDLYTSSLVLLKAFIDSDKDGLSDEQEVIYKTEPNNPDTDGDKLTDGQEVFLVYTNPLIKDTDGDRLPDYEEALITVTSPLKRDTDGNGITDDLEDNDKDTINNYDEILLQGNPNSGDTDSDGLKDGDEKARGTKLNNSDTDEDGLSDFKEVELGTNPLLKDTDGDGISDGDEVFKTKLSAQGVDVDVKANPTLELDLKGSQIESLKITKVNENDLFLASDIAGFIGSGYEFNVNGTFTTAKLTFEFDNALLKKAGFAPRIYYLNEQTQRLEELQNQTVVGNTVAVNLTHFSKYILLDKTEFDKIWETEIKPPVAEDGTIKPMEVAFVIDASYSMDTNDPDGIRKDTAKLFVDKLSENDKAAVISFTKTGKLLSGLTNDKEALKTSIDSIVNDDGYNSNSGTALSEGMKLALQQFKNLDKETTKYIIELTDGEDNYSYDYEPLIQQAKDNNIIVYTIGLGSSVDDELLTNIAIKTGGKYYHASVADDLLDQFDKVTNETIDYNKDTDTDGLCDYYEIMINQGKLRTGTGRSLAGQLSYLDKYNKDTDADGLEDGDEILIREDNDIVYIFMKSDPTSQDTEGDGLLDGTAKIINGKKSAPKDPDPLKANGPIGIWQAQFEQEVNGNIPSKLGDWYDMNWELSFSSIFAGVGSLALNFKFDDKDIAIHSQVETWQKLGGYNAVYDWVFRKATNNNMKKEEFKFNYDEQDYNVWTWRGDYLNLGSGAEIGIYENPHNVLFTGVKQWDAVKFTLPMTLNLYNYNEKDNIENVFSWAPDEPQWWITGFNPIFDEPRVSEMVSLGTVDFDGREGMFDALKKSVTNDPIRKDFMIFDEDGHTVWLIWWER